MDDKLAELRKELKALIRKYAQLDDGKEPVTPAEQTAEFLAGCLQGLDTFRPSWKKQ